MIERLAWVLVCALVGTLPWEKSLGPWTRVLGGAALLGGIAAAWTRGSVRRPNLVIVMAALFAGWSALTWFWSLDPAATLARAVTYAQLLLMVYLIWDTCRTRARQRQLLWAYVAGAVAASGLTILRYMADVQTYYRRYAAPGFDPNDLGLTVALAIPMALYLAMRSRAAWLARAAVVPVGAAILLTASRTSLLVACFGFAFAALTWRRADGVQRAVSAALLAGVLAGALWLAPKPARDRIATTGAELTKGTLHNRTRIWKTGLRALRQWPLVGAGAGAYPVAVRPWLGVPPRAGHEYVAHNSFLSVLVETGLIGFACYVLLFGAAAAFVWALAGAERALYAVLLLAWAIGVSTLTWEHRKVSWLLLALISTEWARAFREERA